MRNFRFLVRAGLVVLLLGTTGCSQDSASPNLAPPPSPGAERPSHEGVDGRYLGNDPSMTAPWSDEVTGAGDLTISSAADLWPQFRGRNSDGISNEKGLLNEFGEEGPKVIWSRHLTGGFSSMAISRGKLVTMTKFRNDEKVICLNSRTGQKLWQIAYRADYAEYFGPQSNVMTRAPSGPRGTPAIVGNRVYTMGTTGVLHSIDLETGNVAWKAQMSDITGEKISAPFGVTVSPLVFDGVVYVTTGGTKDNAYAALKAETGEVLWKAANDEYAYSSPQVMDFAGQKAILFFTGNGAVAVAPKTGETKFRFDFRSYENQNTMIPLVSGNKIFISSAYHTGRGVVFSVGDDGKTSEVWNNNKVRFHFSSPVLHQNVIYGFQDGGRLRAVNFETGEILWNKSGYGRGSVIIADGKLIVLSDQGQISIAKTSSDSFEPIAEAEILNGRSWTAPILAGGILYLRNETEIKAIDFRGDSFSSP